MLRRSVTRALATLTVREQDIVRHRFGFSDGGRGLTLEEIGKKYGVTRERIRQIEAKALEKLRVPRRLRLILGESEVSSFQFGVCIKGRSSCVLRRHGRRH